MFRHEVAGQAAGRGAPAAGEPAAGQPAAGQPAFPRILLVILLVALVLAGLRGAFAAPHWNGPLHTDGTAVGGVFAVVLAALLAATLIRGRRVAGRAGPEPAAVARLRGWLRATLTAGLIAVVILVLASTHFNLFTKRGRPYSAPSVSPPAIRPTGVARPAPATPSSAFGPVLYALLIALAVAVAGLGLVWVLRQRRPVPALPPGEPEFDPAGLREAVASGRAALRELDDARAAIVACYVAMEQSLARKGAARAAADTPDELLARATAEGIVRGAAAGRLTRLFYEARFSSHRLAEADREQAARALDELAAELREPGPAGPPGPPGSGTTVP